MSGYWHDVEPDFELPDGWTWREQHRSGYAVTFENQPYRYARRNPPAGEIAYVKVTAARGWIWLVWLGGDHADLRDTTLAEVLDRFPDLRDAALFAHREVERAAQDLAGRWVGRRLRLKRERELVDGRG